MSSPATFRNAKDLAVFAESKASQAVHLRLSRNASEAENYTQRAAEALAPRSLSFPLDFTVAFQPLT